MEHTTEEYENFLALLKKRHSCRRFKADPLPEGAIEKILEAARWAMSGANSQPWEFIVVRDPKIIQTLYNVYRDYLMDYNFWMEQKTIPELRHPAYMLEGTLEEQHKAVFSRKGWSAAPALIAVLGDGRRQLGSVSGVYVPGRNQSHLTDALANAETLIHLAAASLGLASQWVSLQVPGPFEKILGVPDVMTMHSIIPVGYPFQEKLSGIFRRKLKDITHFDKYDNSKYMTNKDIIDYLYFLRKGTFATYSKSRGSEK